MPRPKASPATAVKKTQSKPKTKTFQVKTPAKLPPNPFVSEILDLVSKQRGVAKKVSTLKEYRNDALTAILIWNYDDAVQSAIPDGEVPYEKNDVPAGTDHTSLRKEWKNLYHFIKGGNPTLSTMRRETMFIQMLEGLHPEEAEVIALVKDKNLESKYKITKGVVETAFPDIVWGKNRGS